MRFDKLRLATLVLGVFLLFGSVNLFAQTATLRGFVYLKKTGEPLLYTYVYLQGTTYGTTTDVNGYFSLTHIPEGAYTVIVASLGYDTVRESVTLKKDQILSKKFYVAESAVNLGGVSISAAQQRRKTSADVSTYVITPKEMKQIPTIGGQPDIAQYLQILPGVIFTGDQGGQLYIEGGQPIQNKVLLDGMTIFDPFHSIGLFSVFDGDIISDATVYAGGFNADYGDRISSIMDIRTRDGNKKNVTGKIDASPFGAHALVEGPLIKNANDDPDKASMSFILSAKNSYLGQTSKTIYPWVDSGHGIPFNYADYYGKLSLNTSNGSKLNIFGFDYTDKVTYPGIDTLKWQEAGFGTNIIAVLPGNSLLEGNIDFSNYSINDKELYSQPSQSSINTFNMGLKNTYFLGNLNIVFGFDFGATRTHYNVINAANRAVEIDLTSNEAKAFIKFKWLLFDKKLVLEPGFRVQYYTSSDFSALSPEPRFDAKYNISKKLRIKFAAGIYSQNLVSAINEEQVVDLFYAILTSPPNADIPSSFTTQSGNTYTVTNPLQRAYHLTGGIEYDPTDFIHINVEAYQKNFLQTSTLNYNQIYDNTSQNSSQPDTLKKPFLVQSGNAYGADISVRYDHKELTLYGVYSLGFVNYWTGTYAFPPPFDRRHNVNLVASYTFGKDLSWMVNIRWNYGSGFPFTPTQAFYPNVPFTNIGTNYTTSNANMGILYGTFDSQRLPDYSRVDISVDKSFQLSQAIGLHINASVINVLNRQNIFYFNRNTDQRVNQLPILPTLSIAMTF